MMINGQKCHLSYLVSSQLIELRKSVRILKRGTHEPTQTKPREQSSSEQSQRRNKQGDIGQKGDKTSTRSEQVEEHRPRQQVSRSNADASKGQTARESVNLVDFLSAALHSKKKKAATSLPVERSIFLV